MIHKQKNQKKLRKSSKKWTQTPSKKTEQTLSIKSSLKENQNKLNFEKISNLSQKSLPLNQRYLPCKSTNNNFQNLQKEKNLEKTDFISQKSFPINQRSLPYNFTFDHNFPKLENNLQKEDSSKNQRSLPYNSNSSSIEKIPEKNPFEKCQIPFPINQRSLPYNFAFDTNFPNFDKNSFKKDSDLKRKRFYSVCVNTLKIEEDAYQKNYKTEICKNFEFKGFCPFGETCCFAHGENELREKNNFNCFYKTKFCKQFFEHYFCPYGYRCQYLHHVVFNKNFENLFFLKVFDGCRKKTVKESLEKGKDFDFKRLKVFEKIFGNSSC